MFSIEDQIRRLVLYARHHLGADPRDERFRTNILLERLGLDAPTRDAADEENIVAMTVPDAILGALGSYAVKTGIIPSSDKERFESELMSVVMPNPSQIEDMFRARLARDGAVAAFDELYAFHIAANTVRAAAESGVRIRRTENGRRIEIGILTERCERETNAAETDVTEYPPCRLCVENIGRLYGGTRPSGRNLRTVPLRLGGEDMIFSYVPYSAVREEFVVANVRHEPLRSQEQAMTVLFDFVDAYPTFFVGSESGLRGAGDPFAAHEHYRGGADDLPMFSAGYRSIWFDDGELKLGLLDWYASVVRFESADRDLIERTAADVISVWESFSDVRTGILARTDEQHNGVAIVVRRKNGTYILDLVLRNARADDARPDGVYGIRPEHTFLGGSSPIGLIGALGLILLPARVQRQLGWVERVLDDECARADLPSDMEPYGAFLDELTAKYGVVPKDEVRSVVWDETAEVCRRMLDDIAVFRDGTDGASCARKFRDALKFRLGY